MYEDQMINMTYIFDLFENLNNILRLILISMIVNYLRTNNQLSFSKVTCLSFLLTLL